MGCSNSSDKASEPLKANDNFQVIPGQHVTINSICPLGHGMLSYAWYGFNQVQLKCSKCQTSLSNCQFAHCRDCPQKDFYCLKCAGSHCTALCSHGKPLHKTDNNWDALQKYTNLVPACRICKLQHACLLECPTCHFVSCISCGRLHVGLMGAECWTMTSHSLTLQHNLHECMHCSQANSIYACVTCKVAVCYICINIELSLQCKQSPNNNHSFVSKHFKEALVCTFIHATNRLITKAMECKYCGWLICKSCHQELKRVSQALSSIISAAATLPPVQPPPPPFVEAVPLAPPPSLDQGQPIVKPEHPDEQQPPPVQQAFPNPVPQPPEKKEEEKAAGDESELCKICYNKAELATFVPCGHQGACLACAKTIKDCPFCHKNIENVIKVYRLPRVDTIPSSV